jgi:hypothetical protein
MIAIYQRSSYIKNFQGGILNLSYGSSKAFPIYVALPKEIDNPKEFQYTYSQ